MSIAYFVALVALMAVAINSNPLFGRRDGSDKKPIEFYKDVAKCLGRENVTQSDILELKKDFDLYLTMIQCGFRCGGGNYLYWLNSRHYWSRTDDEKADNCMKKFYSIRTDECDDEWKEMNCTELIGNYLERSLKF